MNDFNDFVRNSNQTMRSLIAEFNAFFALILWFQIVLLFFRNAFKSEIFGQEIDFLFSSFSRVLRKTKIQSKRRKFSDFMLNEMFRRKALKRS